MNAGISMSLADNFGPTTSKRIIIFSATQEAS